MTTHVFTNEEGNQAATLEEEAKDIIRASKALEGALALRLGVTVRGLTAKEYLATLKKLIDAIRA